jgi:hypothetical protein
VLIRTDRVVISVRHTNAKAWRGQLSCSAWFDQVSRLSAEGAFPWSGIKQDPTPEKSINSKCYVSLSIKLNLAASAGAQF